MECANMMCIYDLMHFLICCFYVHFASSGVGFASVRSKPVFVRVSAGEKIASNNSATRIHGCRTELNHFQVVFKDQMVW